MFLKLSRSCFTVSRSYLAFPVGIFEIPLASLRRSQSANIVVKASHIPLEWKEAACKEEHELLASSPWEINCQILCYKHSPQGCGSIIISLSFMSEGISSTWAGSWYLDQWAFPLFLCIVWLWFPFGSFLVCQGNQQCRIWDRCSLKRNLGRLWNPKQNCLLYFQSLFLFEMLQKIKSPEKKLLL